MGVVTKRSTMTVFGELVERYRKRAGQSQKAFALRMSNEGYPSYGQRMHSHLLYHPSPRVYPCFFEAATRVLGLSVAEQQELFAAWLSMAEEMVPGPLVHGQASDREQGNSEANG